MKYKWMQEPLREVVGYIAKGIPPAYVENESSSTIRVLNQKCNRDFTINYAESRLHNLVQRDVPQEKYLRNDDILINSTGTGTAGRVAQLLHVPCPTVIDGHMILIRPNDKIISRYLGYAIKAHQKEILQLDEGSTGQTELNRERLLSEILISYPQSLALQKDIADTFSALDARIVENKKINHHLPSPRSATDSSPDIRRGKSVSRSSARRKFSSLFSRICANKGEINALYSSISGKVGTTTARALRFAWLIFSCTAPVTMEETQVRFNKAYRLSTENPFFPWRMCA